MGDIQVFEVKGKDWGASLPAARPELQLVFLHGEESPSRKQLVVVLEKDQRIDLAMKLLSLDGMEVNVSLKRPREPKKPKPDSRTSDGPVVPRVDSMSFSVSRRPKKTKPR